MHKKELRSKYKSLRASLSENEIEEKSLAIANKLLALPIWENTYFHIFLPIIEQKEVDTEVILHMLAGKDKEIIVSKSDFESRKMTNFLRNLIRIGLKRNVNMRYLFHLLSLKVTFTTRELSMFLTVIRRCMWLDRNFSFQLLRCYETLP